MREVAPAREHDAEIEVRLPQVRIDLDRLAEQGDGARLHARILRRRRALDHALHGERIRRRQAGLHRLRPGRRLLATARGEQEQEERVPLHFAPFFFGAGAAGAGFAGAGFSAGAREAGLPAGFGASPRRGASMRAGSGVGPCERTSKPVSLNAG